MKYYMNEVAMPGSTAVSDRFTVMSSQLAANVAVNTETPLCDSTGTSFFAQLQPDAMNINRFHVVVTGTSADLTRTINTDYSFGVREESVFDYGVATKGPLQLSGNILLDGTNIAVEADVYIESESDDDALSIIGNSQIAGDVKITNPEGTVTLQGAGGHRRRKRTGCDRQSCHNGRAPYRISRAQYGPF